jgi:hypothetical protein
VTGTLLHQPRVILPAKEKYHSYIIIPGSVGGILVDTAEIS